MKTHLLKAQAGRVVKSAVKINKRKAKKSTVKSRKAEYEKALFESYQQKGGTVKKRH